MDVNPPEVAIYRYWSIATWQTKQSTNRPNPKTELVAVRVSHQSHIRLSYSPLDPSCHLTWGHFHLCHWFISISISFHLPSFSNSWMGKIHQSNSIIFHLPSFSNSWMGKIHQSISIIFHLPSFSNSWMGKIHQSISIIFHLPSFSNSWMRKIHQSISIIFHLPSFF